LLNEVPGFTARDTELRVLDALLMDDGAGEPATRIAAVTGAAGVGKTALVTHWAHRVRARFPDGQLYVDLRGHAPTPPLAADAALAQLLTSLGLQVRDIPLDTADRSALFRTLTGDRRMLLVLDNAATSEQVRPLLPGSATVMVVVTSRNMLGGLVALQGAAPVDVGPLPGPDAVVLLRRLIGSRVDDARPAAADLARLCAYLPLALRVAAEHAARHPSTPLPDLTRGLSDGRHRLDLLDGSDDPYASVRAVFSWSIARLPAAAADAFRRLGLHPGPTFDGYAVAALIAAPVEEAAAVLATLARAHLVQRTGNGRFSVHDLLHQYAAELCQSSAGSPDDMLAAQMRLLDYYLAGASRAMDVLYPADRQRPGMVAAAVIPAMTAAPAALAWLDAELPTIRSIVAVTAGGGPDHYAERLAATLSRYLDGSRFIDAIAIHTDARSAARRRGDEVAEARAMTDLGRVHRQLGQPDLASGLLRAALHSCRRHGAQHGAAYADNQLGVIAEQVGRYADAEEHYRQALAGYRAVQDRAGVASVLSNLGNVDEQRGRYDAAAAHHAAAIAMFREVGDRHGQACALTNRGLLDARRGDHELAADRHRHAIGLFTELGVRSGQAHARTNLGDALTSLDRPADALWQHNRALALFQEIGDRYGEANALNGAGAAQLRLGQVEQAEQAHTAALAIAASTADDDEVARAHTGIGHCHRAAGDIERARRHWRRALSIYTRLGSPDAESIEHTIADTASPVERTTWPRWSSTP
jgi:tetratricopeptide (TPR) repeat protein